MMAGDKLQDAVEQKDRAMIAHKQKMNRERLARLHGPMRDEAAMRELDAQIAQKKKKFKKEN
jgi:hypothetical protein